MYDLSIIIPARNEIFLTNTIKDILDNKKGSTQVIAVLDGYWPDPGIKDHKDVIIIHNSESIGQRAATNQGARITDPSTKYIMKVDAHCAFAPGFDVTMMESMEPDITMAPVMRNLHAFNWLCKNNHRRYQGISGPCEECGEPTEMEVVWIAKTNPQSTAYRFDRDMHFQYWNEFGSRQIGDLTETMSLQGSCFMLTREKYFELDISSEKDFHSWGQQGVEVACKTWLSGGRVLVNRKTWYAHMFRTKGGDFGFPYPNPGNLVIRNREKSKELFADNKWEGAKYSFEWLIKKFSPPDWEDYIPAKKDIIYYTCNTHSLDIETACREQLKKSGLNIISVSLNKDIDFGDTRLRMDGQRGPEMMHRQILQGLMNSDAKYVFLCESDVLYHPSHFLFTPKKDDIFYYNTNVWKTRYPDGHSVWTDDLKQVSGICANRELLIDFYTKKIQQIEQKGFDGHYEPGCNQSIYGYHKGGKYGSEMYQSEAPNVCIRHDSNLTKSKWSVDDFRNKKYAKGWKEADEVPGWGKPLNLLER
jgi:glycosyltransferase involved in cell wall biosynthesis